jgi:hypothetical protein
VGQDLSNWYTAGAAAKRLSENSKRHIDPAYVRQLAEKGLVETLPLGPRTTLYKKQTIDGYIVEPRGVKAGRAMHARKIDSNRTAEERLAETR